MKIKNWPRVIGIFAVLFVIAYVGVGKYTNITLPGKKVMQSFVPSFDRLSTKAKVNMDSSATEVAIPTSKSPSNKGTDFRKEGYEWQSQIAEMLAAGGSTSVEGSLMEKYGVRYTFIRQDDTNISKQNFLKFANAYSKEMKSNPAANPSEGIHAFTIMGSGAAAQMESLEAMLDKINLHAEIIGYSTGSSDGEDKFMGPPEWKKNKEAAKGGVVACVPRDGDQDIVFLWARQNNILVNTDSSYYDPTAINFYEVDDFKKAGEAVIGGTTISRPWKVDGKIDKSKKTSVDVRGVASWFPVDLNVIMKKGDVATIASTKEYPWQMPNITIGIKEWDEAHRDVILGWIMANAEAADQIKKFPEALKFAAEISTQVYQNKEMKANDYVKAFKGYPVSINGNTVIIGGSSVKNLADNLYMFGKLPENNENLYANTYTEFGKMQSKAYPKDLEKFPAIEKVLNLTYLMEVATKMKNKAVASEADVPTYTESTKNTETMATANFVIEFESGSAEFTTSATPVLEDLLSQVQVTNQYVQVNGYTDSQGGVASNQVLSQRRADAVKAWLEHRSSGTIKDNRVTATGKGISYTYSNKSADGRAKNRRIEIKLVKPV